MKKTFICGFLAASLLIAGCSKEDDPDVNPPSATVESLVVVNAGNFNYSNSSITLWNQETGASQEVFTSVNGYKLGDVAQSATVCGDLLWIVVNNSNVVFAVDKTTFKEKGRIDSGLSSPRYIHFVSEDKAYVSQMNTNKMAIVNPKTYTVTGYIDIDVPESSVGMGSTEEMVQIGDYVYVNLWSYGNSIVKIDTRTDKEVGSTVVGVQPYSIVKDCDNILWALCDGGGWSENPAGYEAPTLVHINPEEMRVIGWIELPMGLSVSKLCTNESRTHLYFISNEYDENGVNKGGVCMLDVKGNLPVIKTVVPAEGRQFYSMTVSPATEEIFVGDALDYQQPGVIYRYSSDGKMLDSFNAGIIPTSYAWIMK